MINAGGSVVQSRTFQTTEEKMRKAFWFLCAVFVALFACDKTNEPVTTERTANNIPSNAVAIGPTGCYMVPAGTQTTWWCVTDSAFDYAFANKTVGDVVNLTRDDVVYTTTGYAPTINGGGIYGMDSGRSEIDLTDSDYFKIKSATIDNIFFDEIFYNEMEVVHDNDSTAIVNCKFDGTTTAYSRLMAYGGNIYIRDCEIADFSPGFAFDSLKTVHIWNHDFIEYNAACQTTFYQCFGGENPTRSIRQQYITQQDTAYLHSFIYGGDSYSFDDLEFTGSSAAWIAGDSLVVIATATNKNLTGYLNYGDDDCSEYQTTMTPVNNSSPSPWGSTIFHAKVDIGFATGSPKNTVYWSVCTELCDKVIELDCTIKYKPKTPDSDPPKPQE
jgi:hypothetical protein